MIAADHAADVAVWLTLARAFEHGWLARFDALGLATPLSSLDALRAVMGGQAKAMGALEGGCDARGYTHVSSSRRLTWVVVRLANEPHRGDLFVKISAFRSGDCAAGTRVIDVEIDSAPSDSQVAVVDPDNALILSGDYGRRHVAVVHTALAALATLPIAKGGITKKQAVIAVKMLQAGAS